jgi:signal peptidase I
MVGERTGTAVGSDSALGSKSPASAPVGGRGRRLSGLVVALGCVLFLGGFAWGTVHYTPYTVPTGSMAPTISAGDRVLAQHIDGSEVHRGDVVVFNEPTWANVPLVKRVVAVGGDTVSC